MIKSVSIKNYRGIKNLELNNFKKYNFFVGDNGSCKTTAMEAVFSAMPNGTSAPIVAANSRGMLVTSKTFDSFFYNTEENNKIELILNNEIFTEITTSETKELLVLNDNVNIFNTSKNKEDKKLLYKYKQKFNENNLLMEDIYISENNMLSSNVAFNDKKNWNQIMEKYGLFCWMTQLTKYNQTTANTIKQILEDKKKEKFLELLKIFDSKIDDIFSDGQVIKISKEGMKKLVPISAFGTGISAILDILSCFTDNTKVIFIDEIETGIHYANFPKLIDVLIKLSNKKDIQLFFTTHSREFIEDFYKNIENNNEVSLFRFENTKSGVKSTYFNTDEVLNNIEAGWDLR